MKIALLQEERYIPSFHGSNKSNRALLESLAREGHECLAICTAIPAGGSLDDFQRDMASWRIDPVEESPGTFSWHLNGVMIRGMPVASDHGKRSAFIHSGLREFDPDVVVVSSSRHSYQLESALSALPDSVVYLVHGHHDLPFGPLTLTPCTHRAELLRKVRLVLAMSRYSQEYLYEFGGLDSVAVNLPVYGKGPFSAHGGPDQGCVTLIRPSATKGVCIFLGLAAHFPQHRFAVVHWDLASSTRSQIQCFQNIEIWDPADDIDQILSKTRVLLMPSLAPETFGLAAPEAMLRGIPVVASNLGGLPEAMLGVDYSLPVTAARPVDGEYIIPIQDLNPWKEALGDLLNDRGRWQQCSINSRTAATRFVASVSVRNVEDILRRVKPSRVKSQPAPVAVVDPFDAGYLLLQEIRRRQYPAVGVISNPHIDADILSKYNRDDAVRWVDHNGDTAATVRELLKLGVKDVLPGCETGVMLTDTLSERIGHTSNGTAQSPERRDKFLMAEAARRNSIPVPDQCCSGDLQELLRWAQRHAKWPVVVKPPQSLASDQVRICRSEAEVSAAFESTVGKRNIAGVVNTGLIVQELMDAPQYVVDTMPFEGRHYLSGIWKYGRPPFASAVLRALSGEGPWPALAEHIGWNALVYGAIGSTSKEILQGSGEAAEALFDYACRVLDAIGIRYGPCHFELMWTDRGIRLVEVGARVHGAPQTHMVSRMCLGTSQVDQTVDLYLNPEHFLKTTVTTYSLRWHAMMVRLTVWHTGVLHGFRGLNRIEGLRSFRQTFVMAEAGRRVPGCVGVVILLHPDEWVIKEDFEYIRDLESQDLFELGNG